MVTIKTIALFSMYLTSCLGLPAYAAGPSYNAYSDAKDAVEVIDSDGYAGAPFFPICISKNRLKLVHTQYYGFDGQIHHGTIRVLDALAPAVKNIFNTLLKQKFAINSMVASPIQGNYVIPHVLQPGYISFITNDDGDNTAAYSCRPITGGSLPSLHAYGAAIDLNPRENPYIGINWDTGAITGIIPKDGYKNINRRKFRFGKPVPIGRSEDVIDVFADNGIVYWGGYWNYPIDYMHFEITRVNAILLMAMTPVDAAKYFKLYTRFYNRCKAQFPVAYKQRRFSDLTNTVHTITGKTALELYQESPQRLFNSVEHIFDHISEKACVKK